MLRKWVVPAAAIAAMSFAGCSEDGGGKTPIGQAPESDTVAVRGNLVGALTQAPGQAGAPVALPVGLAIILVDERGQETASQAATAANGHFALTALKGHDYVMVARQEAATGRTRGVLIADSISQMTSFALGTNAADLDLGAMVIDLKQGKLKTTGSLFLPSSAALLPDADGDSIADVADRSADEDQDSVNDAADRFPFDEAEAADADEDGLGDNADTDDDNDGVSDSQDAFPILASEWRDNDGDHLGDNADIDDDNDGVDDSHDAFPEQASESADTDGDGIGNGADDDDDDDGVPDSLDAFPTGAWETKDSDGDRVGDNADTDDDNDGVSDSMDAFPLIPTESQDSDGDRVGDNADLDDDNDGVSDSMDAFPLNPTESQDTDGDGVGNNADMDDDGDGVVDAVDAFPTNATESVDTDWDGIGNVADTDDDGDLVPDVQDAFPLDPAESVDTDLDGIGNAADPDDDNDLAPDVVDNQPLVANVSDVPTQGRPSPLFGALAWEQQMLLFEEFGTEPFPSGPVAQTPFPPPVDAGSGPEPTALEAFLAQDGLAPFATRLANDLDENPWRPQIEAFLGRALDTPPAEGRPPGEEWAHQRWTEFYPQAYYKTCLAGSRVNGGFRDARQRHGYAVGEFGPGGLYNTVFTSSIPGGPTLQGTTNGVAIQIHPRMPVQGKNSIWTFDGTLPPKLLQVRYGQPTLMRNYNALPIDDLANNGFGKHTITTHDHNGHSPGESDGFAAAYFYPGEYYDYRWPMQIAGYDTINTTASDPRAAFPCEPGETLPVDEDGDGIPTLKSCVDGRIQIRGDWRETMSTHWFHDHMLDHTAENVYKGNATMMNYYSALDRGNEAVDDGVNLRLPSGTALSWGNRDYDVNLLVGDKAWGQDGQLWYFLSDFDGFIGDRLLANWQYKPYMDVRARRYRFRILNGGVSRYLSVALVEEVQGAGGQMPGPAGSGVSYNRVPFYLVANDGNLMEHTVAFDGTEDLDGDGELLDNFGQLPTQSIAERYDIVVDFAAFAPGTKLYFVNAMEHRNGKETNGKIPLEQIMSEVYKAQTFDSNLDGTPDRWINGDPGVGKFMELRVKAYAGTDLSMNPADYLPGRLSMIPLTIHRDDPADQALLAAGTPHSMKFVRSEGGSLTPWQIVVDGGQALSMDPTMVRAQQDGTPEIWTIEGTGGWDHPVHIHFEEGVILTRGGIAPPAWETWARKDMYRVGPDEDGTLEVVIAYRARDFVGTMVEHCHNTMHEDHAMLMRWDAVRPGQVKLIDTPVPGWDGVELVPSSPEGHGH
ncbi:MAG: thrombospondin type 3 repeat-containing protein [Deltaproteobacteria bacterium]|nr:thrombospondin type 3 repeat-containing protein [Deltaproteobacteria bacterium]